MLLATARVARLMPMKMNLKWVVIRKKLMLSIILIMERVMAQVSETVLKTISEMMIVGKQLNEW